MVGCFGLSLILALSTPSCLKKPIFLPAHWWTSRSSLLWMSNGGGKGLLTRGSHHNCRLHRQNSGVPKIDIVRNNVFEKAASHANSIHLRYFNRKRTKIELHLVPELTNFAASSIKFRKRLIPGNIFIISIHLRNPLQEIGGLAILTTSIDGCDLG